MGTEMAVPFANISIVEIKTKIIQQSKTEPRKWKRYIDNVFSLWDWDRKEIDQFIKRTNYFHCTIKFTAEISENQITFLDATVFKGERFAKDSILDIRTQYKPTETFQFTHFISCDPPGVKHGFIKVEAIRLLRTYSSKEILEEGFLNFKQRLKARGYLENIKERSLSGQLALTHSQKPRSRKFIAFCHNIQPGR